MDNLKSPISEKIYQGPMTIDQVTPELAAQIVKQFVIPMFDHDSRTGNLRKKTTRRGESMFPDLAKSNE